MRSSERYGILAIAMLLLWGTSLTEPFRYFAEKCFRLIAFFEGSIGISYTGMLGSLLAICLMIAITLVMMLIRTRWEESDYMSSAIVVLISVATLIGCFKYQMVDFSSAIPIIIWIVIIAICSAMRKKRILMWITDCFTMSLPVFWVCALVFTPIKTQGLMIGKYVFSSFRTNIDLAACFDGLLGVSFFVWGLFIAVMASLPVIYYSFRGREG